MTIKQTYCLIEQSKHCDRINFEKLKKLGKILNRKFNLCYSVIDDSNLLTTGSSMTQQVLLEFQLNSLSLAYTYVDLSKLKTCGHTESARPSAVCTHVRKYSFTGEEDSGFEVRFLH